MVGRLSNRACGLSRAIIKVLSFRERNYPRTGAVVFHPVSRQLWPSSFCCRSPTGRFRVMQDPKSAPGARCICGGCCAVCMKTTSAHVSVSGQPLQTSITSPSTGSVLWHPSVVLPVPQRRTLSGCNTLAFTSTVDPRIPLPRKLRHHGECSSLTSAATRCVGVRLRVCTERLHSY